MIIGSIEREHVMRTETAWADRAVCQALMLIAARLCSKVARLQQARQARAALRALDDGMLKDIGVSRSEIEWVARHGAARERRRARSLESCRRPPQRSDPSADSTTPAREQEARSASTLVDLASIRETRRTQATNPVVTPAKAGVQTPEPGGYGPRLSPR